MYILVKDGWSIQVVVKSVSINGFNNLVHKIVTAHDATIFATEELAEEMLDLLYDGGNWEVATPWSQQVIEESRRWP